MHAVHAAYAALLATDLRFLRGLPRKEFSSASKTKGLAYTGTNIKINGNLVLFTDRNKFSFKYPGV